EVNRRRDRQDRPGALMPRPKLLAVSSELPWPLNSGGHLRTFHLLTGLARHFDVHLVAPAAVEDRASVDSLREHGISAEPVLVPPKTAMREAFRAAHCRARSRPYVMYGRHTYTQVKRHLDSLTARLEPAVLYLDHLDSFVYRDCCPR